jgi:SCY1-like protein 1
LVLAQRSIQKLRTLKHPSVLGFVDSTDLEDQLILVTEHCKPLNVWLKEQLATNTVTMEDKILLFEEALWGFKCILTALSFLHAAGRA